ncbi:MAG: hypothetical protein C4538_06845 [Nitrospiraceae bacterium]|nr:MAG: hypothetical protein C4538_06845 [Nitrospiraceae bacterium]
MNKPINIFIPAAGFGERLRPITNLIPKPLLPVLGKSVLQIVLEKLSGLPVGKIGINLHHKKEAVEEWIKQSIFHEKVVFFPEENILGTGGALKNAESSLNENTFLVHNSDIISDMDSGKLLEHHLSSGNLVTLAVHDHPKFNNVSVDSNGFLKGVKAGLRSSSANERIVAFTGIAVYEPGFLKFLPEGPSSVVDAWLEAVSAGHKIGTFDVSGCYWSDIGTPAAYAAAVFDFLKGDGETVYVHPSTRGCGNVEMQGYVVIEKGWDFDKNISLRNCILLPSLLTGEGKGGGWEISSHGAFQNCIIGPDLSVSLSEPEIFGVSLEEDKIPIGTGGSDRKYYRVKRGRKFAVLMQCRRDDPDFIRQMEYTRFFLRYSVPVPDLLEEDLDEKEAVFEDAGDTSLYNWLKCPREGIESETMYRKVIDILVYIHTNVTDYAAECLPLKNRLFDYKYFRWETDYFAERFLEGIRSLKVEHGSNLENEFHQLAFLADSFPRTIIHRDFQSQNIMVRPDGGLRIIDFQGARMGPSAYDVASILWDPYHRLEDSMRERLVDYYITKIEDKFDADYFRQTLAVCRLQRHMQALGAYGFLSSEKGKKYFLKYVPEGIRLLKEDVLLVKDDYPELYKVVMGL